LSRDIVVAVGLLYGSCTVCQFDSALTSSYSP